MTVVYLLIGDGEPIITSSPKKALEIVNKNIGYTNFKALRMLE